MIIDIFIRSYQKEFPLLQHCLYSILKFVSGFRKIIVCVREKEYERLIQLLQDKQFYLENLEKIQIVKALNYPDNLDYCGQQISKLNADIFTDAEYILYVDSDCVFYDSFDIQNIMFDENKKIILLIEKWEKLPDNFHVWKRFLEKVGLPTPFEFMRRFPFLYPSSILPKVRDYIVKRYNKNFQNSCLTIYDNRTDNFSEFNLLGAYAYINDSQNYHFIMQNDYSNEIPLKQLQNYFYDHSVSLQEEEMKKILHL
jgi:uncharacterized phage-like protein YoqJ